MILMAWPIAVQGMGVNGTSRRFLLDILSASMWFGWNLIKTLNLCFYPLDTWFTRTWSHSTHLDAPVLQKNTYTHRDIHVYVQDVYIMYSIEHSVCHLRVCNLE